MAVLATRALANPLAFSPKHGLATFLRLCQDLPGIDLPYVCRLAMQTIRYLQADARRRQTLRLDQALEQRWYAALAVGAPDWAVYDTDAYLAELWACWSVYSRRYLLNLAAPRSLPPDGILASLGAVHRVVDLGCGIGYSTAGLQAVFPHATVLGTNFAGMRQTQIAQAVGARYSFAVVSTLAEVGGPVDVVFASEYFEHIPAPIAHLEDVLASLRPKALFIANTFNAPAVGHFPSYEVEGQQLDGKTTARRFGAVLRAAGYQKIQTQCWNNRPAYWQRPERADG